MDIPPPKNLGKDAVVATYDEETEDLSDDLSDDEEDWQIIYDDDGGSSLCQNWQIVYPDGPIEEDGDGQIQLTDVDHIMVCRTLSFLLIFSLLSHLIYLVPLMLCLWVTNKVVFKNKMGLMSMSAIMGLSMMNKDIHSFAILFSFSIILSKMVSKKECLEKHRLVRFLFWLIRKP